MHAIGLHGCLLMAGEGEACHASLQQADSSTSCILLCPSPCQMLVVVHIQHSTVEMEQVWRDVPLH